MSDNPSSMQPSQPSPAPSPRKTRGDVLFDRWLYGGLNGVGTFLLTLPLAYWGDHGGGKATFQKFSNFLKERTPLSEQTAKTVVRATTLGLGGTVMVIPVRMIEGIRTPIVQALNRRYGSPEDQAVGAQVVAPQTWGSQLKGRAVAWTVVFGSFKAIEGIGFGKKMEQFEHWVAEHIICKALKQPLRDAMGNESKAFRYGKLAALDAFATAAAAMLFYTGTRFFASHRSEEKQAQLAERYSQNGAHVLADAAGERASSTIDAIPQTMVHGEKQHPGLVTETHTSPTASL